MIIPDKLQPIGEFLALKLKRLNSLNFIKIDSHQDDIKSLNQLTFFEQLNVECDLRTKKIITNTSEDEVITFLLELICACLMRMDNQLILNYPKELTMCSHLFYCECYLKKLLKSSYLIKLTGS